MKTLSELEIQEISGAAPDPCIVAVGVAITIAAAGNVAVGIGAGIVAGATGWDCMTSLATGTGGYSNDTVGAGINTEQLQFLQ